MIFYRLDEVPSGQDDQVFKVSPTGKAIAMVVMFGIAGVSLGLAVRGWTMKGLSPGALYFFALVFGLFALIPLSLFRASIRPSAWLARCGLTGIILKYRGYENWRLPDDVPQAVGFDYGEIASAKLVKENRISPSSGSNGSRTTNSVTYIEFGLTHPDTTELKTRLQAERSLQPDGKVVTDDYPVQVMPGGIVQVRWTGGIRPSAAKAIEILGRHIQVLPTEHRTVDLTHRRGASPKEEQEKIALLAKGGDKLGAVKLARQVYGYSLTNATQHVDQLLSRSDASPGAEPLTNS